MKIAGTPAAAGAGVPDPKDAKLRKVATQMEGAFVQQMYKAMRDTVPTDGMFSGGSGEEMFSSMLDEHVAADTPSQWQHGLSEAIYQQLHRAVQAQRGAGGSSASPTVPAALTPASLPTTPPEPA